MGRRFAGSRCCSSVVGGGGPPSARDAAGAGVGRGYPARTTGSLDSDGVGAVGGFDKAAGALCLFWLRRRCRFATSQGTLAVPKIGSRLAFELLLRRPTTLHLPTSALDTRSLMEMSPPATTIQSTGEAVSDCSRAPCSRRAADPHDRSPTDSGSQGPVFVPAGDSGGVFCPANRLTTYAPVVVDVPPARVLARMCMRALLSRARARASLGRAPRA